MNTRYRGSWRLMLSVCAVVLAVFGVLMLVLVMVPGRPPASDGAASGSLGLPAARPAAGTPAGGVLSGVQLTLGAGVKEIPGSPVPAAQPAAAVQVAALQPTVAPLRRTVQPDFLVVARFSLPAGLLAAVSRLPGVAAAEQIEAVKLSVNGTQTAVLGVDPSQFRSFAAAATGASDALWQGVADGGIAVSYEMGALGKIPLGGSVPAVGQTTRRLRVVAFGTLGIGGVNAVVSDATARSLGAPVGNAIVVSVPGGDFTADSAAITRLLPKGASLEPLASLVGSGTAGAGSGTAGAGASTSPAASTTALDVMLRAAVSRQGMPYVWGGAGPATFDCSGLVQWSFAQAGITMPRVAADQALTGPAVPVSRLAPGDLLFYRTDPTDPGYISHVAIYLGNGQMIQAPQPGMDVEVVPAAFGPEFAGAVRVSPARAASVAASLT